MSGESLRVVATAGSEPEAELIRQRLENEGIGAVTQRTIGSSEWGASGARYVYVESAQLDRARAILGLAQDDDGAER